jgi:hypothetical protein
MASDVHVTGGTGDQPDSQTFLGAYTYLVISTDDRQSRRCGARRLTAFLTCTRYAIRAQLDIFLTSGRISKIADVIRLTNHWRSYRAVILIR